MLYRSKRDQSHLAESVNPVPQSEKSVSKVLTFATVLYQVILGDIAIIRRS